MSSSHDPDQPTIVGPGEGHLLTARGSVMAFKAIGAETGEDFSLMERTLPPRGRKPPAHRHTNCSEAYFVLDGEIAFELDGQPMTGRSGDFLLVHAAPPTPSATTARRRPGSWCCTPRPWTATSKPCTSSGPSRRRRPPRRSGH